MVTTISLFGDWAPQRVQFTWEMPDSDLLLFNLEGPVFSAGVPSSENAIMKAGPHIWNASLPEAVSDSSNRSPTLLFSMANNHLMDYGVSGLRSSISSIEKKPAQHLYCGAGESLSASRAPAVFQQNQLKVLVFSVCEPQFGTSDINSAGVAAQGPWLYARIAEAKARGHVVGISVHGGQEDIPIPSPKRVALYRSFVDIGADFVWGHHSHIPQVFEHHKGKLIAYGLGNFAVDPAKWTSGRNRRSLIFRGSLDASGRIDWRVGCAKIEPLSNSSARAAIKISFRRNEPLGPLRELGEILLDEKAHEALWQEYAFQLYDEYARQYVGWAEKKVHRAIINILHGKEKRKLRDALMKHHMVATSSHREVLETVTGVTSTEIVDSRNQQSGATLRSLAAQE